MMIFGRRAATLAILLLAACSNDRDAVCRDDAVLAALTADIAARAVADAQQMADRRIPGSGATPAAFQSVAADFVLNVKDARVVRGGPDEPRRCAGRLSVTVPKQVLDNAEAFAAMRDKGRLSDLAKAEGFDLEGTTFGAEIEYSLAPTSSGDGASPELADEHRFAGIMMDMLIATVLKDRIRADYDAIRQEEQARAEARAIAADPSRADELADLLERERRAHAADDDEPIAIRAERAAEATEAAAREALSGR